MASKYVEVSEDDVKLNDYFLSGKIDSKVGEAEAAMVASEGELDEMLKIAERALQRFASVVRSIHTTVAHATGIH